MLEEAVAITHVMCTQDGTSSAQSYSVHYPSEIGCRLYGTARMEEKGIEEYK